MGLTTSRVAYFDKTGLTGEQKFFGSLPYATMRGFGFRASRSKWFDEHSATFYTKTTWPFQNQKPGRDYQVLGDVRFDFATKGIGNNGDIHLNVRNFMMQRVMAPRLGWNSNDLDTGHKGPASKDGTPEHNVAWWEDWFDQDNRI